MLGGGREIGVVAIGGGLVATIYDYDYDDDDAAGPRVRGCRRVGRSVAQLVE